MMHRFPQASTMNTFDLVETVVGIVGIVTTPLWLVGLFAEGMDRAIREIFP